MSFWRITRERETPVSAIMMRNVIFVRPDQTIEECMALMTEKRIRHLPVMEDDKVDRHRVDRRSRRGDDFGESSSSSSSWKTTSPVESETASR